MHRCFNCQQPWESSLRQPAVKETCARCDAYLHSCRNCRFHRKGYPNECYIPDTEKVADKSRANFCDEFEFRDDGEQSGARPGDRSALDALLGETTPEGKPEAESLDAWLSSSEKPSRKFDDLFSD